MIECDLNDDERCLKLSKIHYDLYLTKKTFIMNFLKYNRLLSNTLIYLLIHKRIL